MHNWPMKELISAFLLKSVTFSNKIFICSNFLRRDFTRDALDHEPTVYLLQKRLLLTE